MGAWRTKRGSCMHRRDSVGENLKRDCKPWPLARELRTPESVETRQRLFHEWRSPTGAVPGAVTVQLLPV